LTVLPPLIVSLIKNSGSTISVKFPMRKPRLITIMGTLDRGAILAMDVPILNPFAISIGINHGGTTDTMDDIIEKPEFHAGIPISRKPCHGGAILAMTFTIYPPFLIAIGANYRGTALAVKHAITNPCLSAVLCHAQNRSDGIIFINKIRHSITSI
jgi:hypothetical protein